jgi:hypothetical protein
MYTGASTDEAEHVERRQAPAQRAADGGNHVEESHGLQRIARPECVAGDAGKQCTERRAEQRTRDGEAKPPAAGLEMENIAQ